MASKLGFIKNLLRGDFFILFNANSLKNTSKLSFKNVCTNKKQYYICTRKKETLMGRYSSGQRGQTVNLL